MSSKKTHVHFWQGNQACAEGALAAGCRFFAGYPITPASEIAEIMAEKLPEMNGRYLQMEDEIGALSAVVGASWGGHLAMTATSGPGFSLMQENIGYAVMTETPCVVVDVQRVGPSTGQATKCAQGDFLQSRWGTHGDHESIVLSPNSAQEAFELTIKAFVLSEYFRHPVILLSDEVVGHSRERVVIDSGIDFSVRRRFARKGKKPYGEIDGNGHAIMPRFGDGHNLLVTGSTHDERGYRKTSDSEVHRRLVERLRDKILQKRSLLTDTIIKGPEKAEWGIVSYGCTSRTVEEVMFTASSMLSMKSLRLRTVWPFPDREVKAFSESVERLLVPELSLGQLSREVERVVGDCVELVPLNKIGGGLMIEPGEIIEVISSA